MENTSKLKNGKRKSIKSRQKKRYKRQQAHCQKKKT